MKELKIAIAALAAAISFSASSGTGSGKVTGIIIVPGAVIFTVESPLNIPACSSAGEYAIDGSTSDGKNTLAFVLSAASQGRSVSVMGSGNCSLLAGRETVLYVGAGY